MSVLTIIQPNNPTLRRKARPVTRFDKDLQQLIDDMLETLRHANGVGLAAPQVDVPLRLAVIETQAELDEEGNEIEGTRDLYVIANPEIVWQSREEVKGVEGCLSIPGYVGEVSRATSVRVRAQDRFGKKIRLKLHDWDARIFQHEIDHLDGILYIDRLTAPENLWREEEYFQMLEGDDEAQDEIMV